MPRKHPTPYLKNTSPFPDGDVARLVRETYLALRATPHFLDIQDCAVHVKGSSYWWAGMAYREIPRAARVDPGARYLITLRISRKYNKTFPCWQWGYGEKFALKGKFEPDSPLPYWFTNRIIYRWPLLNYDTWQMALVGTLAHEAKHIQQYRYGRGNSEVQAQWAAWYALRGVFGRDAVTFPDDPHQGLQRVQRDPRPSSVRRPKLVLS